MGGGSKKTAAVVDGLLPHHIQQQGNVVETYARARFEKLFQWSDIKDKTHKLPVFDITEIALGKTLGEGGFGVVFEIKAFHLDPTTTGRCPPPATKKNSSSTAERSVATAEYGYNEFTVPDDVVDEKERRASRAFLADNCLRRKNNKTGGGCGEARYALKILKPELLQDEKLLRQGVLDMAIELRSLADINHPNIVKLRGVSWKSKFTPGFFIIMDRLYETLEARLTRWAKEEARSGNLAGRLRNRISRSRATTSDGGASSSNNNKQAASIQEQRLVAAYDLASALEYLHDRKIIYRDIKPENCGFDIRNDIKLFDFGFIRELRDDLRRWDGTYDLTPVVGTPRYMAPEVANSERYNETCDAYSFAVMFWQMLTLQLPYEKYTRQQFGASVLNGKHERPEIDPNWQPAIQQCLKKSWARDLHKRYKLHQIAKLLRAEVVRIRNGDDKGLEHDKRRSTFVFQGGRKNSAATKADADDDDDDGSGGHCWSSTTTTEFSSALAMTPPPPPPSQQAAAGAATPPRRNTTRQGAPPGPPPPGPPESTISVEV